MMSNIRAFLFPDETRVNILTKIASVSGKLYTHIEWTKKTCCLKLVKDKRIWQWKGRVCNVLKCNTYAVRFRLFQLSMPVYSYHSPMMCIYECWRVTGEALYSAALGPPGNHSTVAADSAGPGSTTARKRTQSQEASCWVYTQSSDVIYGRRHFYITWFAVIKKTGLLGLYWTDFKIINSDFFYS